MAIALTTARPALRFAGMALLGSWLLAASAQVSLPMWPVPATLQSLAVLLLGALGGPAAGFAAVVAYLAQGVMGLPVFANGAAGPAALLGPTGGYLLGFALAAWLAGFARGQGFARQALVLLAAHLLLFVPGVAWLSGYVGLARALEAGFLLFVPGTLVKTALALALLRALARR
ncbi:biotin transporter BioY [Falsiroseomonas tokyonensis]|uniref:Biotin transporter n=1 Tax=Falsiroseomonas tokyonensis TaxID=430521 RepID=A0ABV7BVG7_9PROT|nr:biotin transporter BioY [Falsiroseomonas tokyonensis]MBU8539251.1 biotin transporter BioY [Falsiroseomonas tokyonensis]